ncbi:MAG: phosphomannomutase/phosphoglucomutase [Pseudomonadota bacterium]
MLEEQIFPDAIFKAYDIRGIVGKEWNASWSFQIGQAFGTLMREKALNHCVVGRDGRLSSEEFSDALIKGVRSTGINVYDIGLVATPAAYFAEYELNADGALMVTASHNPAEYNGIKMVLQHVAFAGDAIQELKQRVKEKHFALAETLGNYTIVDICKAYQQRVLKGIGHLQAKRIAVDCGNGAMSQHAVAALEALGMEVIPLYCVLDGHFPHHEPDPSKDENLGDLKKIVCEQQCDLGLAFDGDGDRMVAVTSEGKSVASDHMLMFFMESVLADCPGRPVVYDVKGSRAVPHWIKQCGGKPILAKTGHSYMKAAMRQYDACLGAEISGHFFFQDRWYGFDDGLYAAVRLLEQLSKNNNLIERLNAFPNMVTTPEIDWLFQSANEARQTMALIEKDAHFPEAIHIYRLDGLRIEYAHGFALIRASNTSSQITLRFEGDTQEELEKIQKYMSNELLRVCGETYPAKHINLRDR